MFVSTTMDYKTIALVLIYLTTSAFANVNITSPGEGLYDIMADLSLNSGCQSQSYQGLCSGIVTLNYQQCAVLTPDCENPATIRVSFSTYRPQREIEMSLISFTTHREITITKTEVMDVNECHNELNKCSVNGYCANSQGSHTCECGFGYEQPAESTTARKGTYCIKRCINRSCRNGGTCSPAVDEYSDVACDCPPSYTGSICQNVNGNAQLPDWSIILIAVVAGIAACVGICLCAYACYRLFYKKSEDDDSSDTNSIYSFKPKSIPAGEYDRIIDIGSLSRSNRGYASTIDEESEHGDSVSVKNDGLKFGTRLTASRLSIPSEHGDPTPALNPYNRTDRHAASDIISNPDYY